MRNGWSAFDVAADATRAALMTFAPVRRPTSAAVGGPSSPCSCTSEGRAPRRGARPRRAWVLEHAGELDAAAQRAGDAGGLVLLAARGDRGTKIMPSAQAPCSTQSSASSSAVMPQSLTRVTVHGIGARAGRGASSTSMARARRRAGPRPDLVAGPAARSTTLPDVLGRRTGVSVDPAIMSPGSRPALSAGPTGHDVRDDPRRRPPGPSPSSRRGTGARRCPCGAARARSAWRCRSGTAKPMPTLPPPAPPVRICELMPMTRPRRVDAAGRRSCRG